jgi:plasmid stability protein
MTDILLHDVSDELKQKLEARARAHNRTLSDEATALLETALKAPEPSEYGLGTELSKLVPEEYWTDDFIQPRERGERPPPDFT